jgi:hypothetical protein
MSETRLLISKLNNGAGPKDFRGGWRGQECGRRRECRLVRRAPADVSNDCGLIAKSEGVRELSPGPPERLALKGQVEIESVQ